MAKKVTSISPITLHTKKGDPRTYDALVNLNKRVAIQIRKEVAINFSKFADKITEKWTETIFLGYYIDGGYVGVLGNELKFISPVDDYQYKQSQVEYFWSLFSTRTAAATNPDTTAFENGQSNEPAQESSNSGPGELFWINCYVEKPTGAVNCNVSYRIEASATETPTNDGILKVFAICNRNLE
jgi:hypothetical protein